MKYLIFIGILFLVAFSCKMNKNITNSTSKAKNLIALSIQHHDPKGNWNQLNTSIDFETKFWNKKGEIELSSSSISFDNENKIFTSFSERDGIGIDGYVSSDTCYASTKKTLTTEQEEKLKKRLTCDNVIFFRDYYSFLIGMPMKLNDESAIINDTILEREYNGEKYDVVKVTYPPIEENPVWYFYFDKKDHSFQLCKFTSREDENKGGEYIIYNQVNEVQGVKLYAQQVWLYNTPTLDTLAVDDLIFN